MNKELFKPVGIAEIDGNHRYYLSRTWDETKPKVLFIGLNPSRADAVFNDATIIRCINFARGWGYGGLLFGNLYSYRTPYPSELIKNLDTACNPRTDIVLREMIDQAERVICAWGSWNFIGERSKEVLSMIPNPYCMGINSSGQPKHPLYLSRTTQPKVYVF